MAPLFDCLIPMIILVGILHRYKYFPTDLIRAAQDDGGARRRPPFSPFVSASDFSQRQAAGFPRETGSPLSFSALLDRQCRSTL